ncbi:MAG: IS66 family transposase [Pseudomonadota bacterium]
MAASLKAQLIEVRAEIASFKNEVKQLQAQVETLAGTVKVRDKEIRSLKQEKATLLRRIYGPKSDRPSNEAQCLLDKMFAEETFPEEQPPSETEDQEEDRQTKRRKRKRGKPTGRKVLPEHLERREEEVDLPEDEKIDPHTGKALTLIGWETRERLVEEPAQLYVHVLKRAKYARPAGDNSDKPGIITAPEPAKHGNPIDRCKADVSVLATVLTMKYLHHLPLYRLQDYYWRIGQVHLARSTLCGWVIGCSEALEPIYKEMRRRLLDSGYIGLDDTPVRLLEPGNGKTVTARLWSYVGLSGPGESAPYTLYDYRRTREKEGPLEFLGKDYQGYAQADAYTGHDALMKGESIIELGCWDHCHRYFTNASEEDPGAASKALAYIKRLYHIEKQAKDLKLDNRQRQTLREQQAKPLLEEFKQWLDKHEDTYLPKSGMSAAVRYSRNQWAALTEYVHHGRVPISNCLCEQSFKAIATGRNNWLFLGSEEGGKAAAIIFSLTMTCRRLGLDAHRYFDDVLRKVNAYPCNRLSELLPDTWMSQQKASGNITLAPRADRKRSRRPRPTIDLA